MIFLGIWMNYHNNAPGYLVIGFGFLAVVVFNLQHIIYYFAAFTRLFYFQNLSTRFMILSELAESVVIASFIFKEPQIAIGRWKGLLATVLFSFLVSYAAFAFPRIIQEFLISNGGTYAKPLLGLITAFLLLASVIRVAIYIATDKNRNYLFIGLLLMLSGNLFSFIPGNPFSWGKVLGHILRAVSHYCLLWEWFSLQDDCPYKSPENSNERIQRILKLLNGLPVAVISFSSSGKLYFANKHALEMLACGTDELIGLSVKQFIQKFRISFPGLCKKSCEKAANFRESFDNYLAEITNLNGVLTKVRIDCYILENGEYTLIFHDNNKEKEIEHLRLQAKSVLDSTSNFIVITDDQKKIVMCNKVFADLIGQREEDIIGMHIREFKDKLQTKIENFPQIQKPISGDNENNYFISVKTTDGTRKKLLINSSYIRSLDGENIGKIYMAYDISEIEREQQRMQQQEKLSLLEQMGAAIVHETKNYLATIKGSCQVLSTMIRDEHVRKYAQRIGMAADEINRIVMDFLSLSKPHSPALKAASLNEIVGSVIELLKFSSLLDGISVKLSLEPEEKLIVCDESQIRQVVLNICKNAIEALEGIDKPEIRISTGMWDDKGMYIEIADNGKGMDEEQKEMLWTPFYTTKEHGTGLGLSISLNIIQEHGGKIEIESEVGKGSCFRILLPFRNTRPDQERGH